MSILTPEQRRGARLLGQGLEKQDIAAALKVSPSTVTRWAQSAEFQALAERARDPEVRDVLKASLSATDKDGIDWKTRLAGIKILLALELDNEDEDEADDDPDFKST
jgi:DNA-binding MarR family transcriptional regulator